MTEDELRVRSDGLALTIELVVQQVLIPADGDTAEDGTAMAERALVRVLTDRLGGKFPAAARLRELAAQVQREAMAEGGAAHGA